MKIKRFERADIAEVIAFEKELRKEEPDTYFWDIDEKYQETLELSFDDQRFDEAITYLAIMNDEVVGRIDASLIISRFDGKISSAYLDWICVLKDHRHQGIARGLLEELKKDLKEKGITTLIILTSVNEEAKRFYAARDDVSSKYDALWIEFK